MKIFNVKIEDPQGIYKYEMSDHFQYFFQEIINIMQYYIENNKPYCGEYNLRIINLLRNSFLEGNTSIYDKPHKTLFELVDKSTPKQPIKEIIEINHIYKAKKDETNYYCPICDTFVGHERKQQNFCHVCGQKLDWSDE